MTDQTTQVLHVDPHQPDPAVIAAAAAVIRDGGLVAFPTETVYGLGANALDADAVEGIFRAKERPAFDPLIVHLASAEQLSLVVDHVPDIAWVLAKKFWPGPLTLVLPRGPRVPSVVTAGGETVAVRVPSHPVAHALIEAAGVPIAAPSANRFGRVSPTRAEHVAADLGGRIDVILDGGATPVGVESTVLSLLTDPPMILRPGGVNREALAEVLEDVAVSEEAVAEGSRVVSPGTTVKHYAPRANVTLYQGDPAVVLDAMRAAAEAYLKKGERVGILAADEDAAVFENLPVVFQPLGSAEALDEVARHLYAALRSLDRAGVSVILARAFGTAGLGLAIRNRLTRAAAGRVVDVDRSSTTRSG